MDAAQIAENERREQACIEGITAVRLYSEDTPAAELARDQADAVALLEGVILYAQLLEATLTKACNTHPLAIRTAAEASAGKWRTRLPQPENGHHHR